MQSFTLVSTVYNESQRLRQTIEDIENQSLKPSEIIITDAGSSDGTYEQLVEWQRKSAMAIKILQEKGCNVARGRNLAIEAANNQLIVSTDFGCTYHKDWLKSIVKPFENIEIQVVGGAYTVREEEITTTAAKAAYILAGGYELRFYDNFIPSSRSIAYYKEVWLEVGKYPEWLTLAADDLVFGLKILKKGHKIHLVGKPYVYWGRHAKQKSYVKESFRYGLGDGEAMVNKRNFVSNGIEMAFRYLLFVSLIAEICLILFSVASPLILLFSIIFTLGLRSYFNTFKNWLKLKSKKYTFISFVYALILLEKTRLAYISGYWHGTSKSTNIQKEKATELEKILAK